LDQALTAQWSADHVIAYSFKTNYAATESNILKEQGAWAEVVSGREYEMARRLGYPGERIIFNGPYKTDGELKRAIAENARIQVNDPDELERLIAIAQPSGRIYEIGLRVSSNAPGLGQSRFGCSLEDGTAAAAVERFRQAKHLKLAGLHIHLLGDTDDPGCYRRAAEALASFIADHIPEYRESIRFVDLGGGFPAHGPKPRRRTSWNPLEIENYVRAIAAGFGDLWPVNARPTLVVEPGRYLVGDSTIFLTKVVRINDSSASSQTVTCNGAINMLPLIHYCPPIVRAFTEDFEPREDKPLTTKVFGCSCREDDMIFDGSLPEIRLGDYLVYYAVGAYYSNMAPDFIYTAPETVFL
jgi:diaminopimelate decarboxylase